MIRSISFTGKGKEDYINAVHYKTVLKKGVTPEEYEEAKKQCASRSVIYKMLREVRDGYMNPTLRKCVLKHEFRFEPDKINVIFGPNGSGKTTILKTIAENCMCGPKSDGNDGYTSLTKYFHSIGMFTFDEEITKETEMERLTSLIAKKAGNESVIDWDGQPVYYENISGRRTYNEVGNLVGGLIESYAEEMLWHMEKNSTSAGQKTMYLINKLDSVMKRCPTAQQLIDENRTLFERSRNDSEKIRLDVILDYYNRYYAQTDEPYPTLLLDEMDRSLDLINVLSLYGEVLPAIQKHYHAQIIVVSHSPVVLLDKIYNSGRYNIVSMSKRYTSQCRKYLKDLI